MTPPAIAVMLGAALLVAPPASAQGVAPDAAVVVERTVWPMGTRADLRGPAAGVEDAILEIERTEGLLSTWDPATPLSRLNRAAAGTALDLDPELTALLPELAGWSIRTRGAFDPDVGALVDTWGLRDGGRTPAADEVANSLDEVRLGTVERTAEGWVRTGSSTWIDSGGFGKGYALRLIADRAADPAAGTAPADLRIDLGGQLLCTGAASCTVVIAHPDDRTRPAIHLDLTAERFGPVRSVATSGNSERGIVVDGVRIGHVLDPRTGRPATFDGSVTVVSADPMVADLLSTALFVMGPVEGLAFARELPGVDALFLQVVDGELQIQTTEALAPLVKRATGAASRSNEPTSPK